MNKKISVFLRLCILASCSIAFVQNHVLAESSKSLPVAANPEGLAVMTFKDEFNSGFESYLTFFKEKCGYELATDFNIANLSMGTTEEDRRSIPSYCGLPLDYIVPICEKGESYKALVAKKIKKYSCRFLGDTDKKSLKLEGNTLIWSFEYKTESSEDNATYINKVLLDIL